MEKASTTKKGRKNMNLSKEIFRQLDVLRRIEQKRLGVTKVSWDHFFADLLQRVQSK